MKHFYRISDEPVKRDEPPSWTVRWQGYVWHIRAKHADVLTFLRLLASARRAS